MLASTMAGVLPVRDFCAPAHSRPPCITSQSDSSFRATSPCLPMPEQTFDSLFQAGEYRRDQEVFSGFFKAALNYEVAAEEFFGLQVP